MATCFVVMGFGEKTDYRTSRVLDLDKTYRHIIKKAVQAAGLECIRADEIPHSGTIDVPMYEQLLGADLVIADLSTSNLNAAYELGIRHALRPATTIIIAEEQFTSPFDMSHIVLRRYRHDGKALDIDEVERFRDALQQAIADIMAKPRTDSPVYTYLSTLQPPSLAKAMAAAAAAAPAPSAAAAVPPQALSALMDGIRAARDGKQWALAKMLIASARALVPEDSYLVQQLALVTYKSEQPDPRSALEAARQVLLELTPLGCNNAETLGLWGAVHKRLHVLSQDPADLDAAIFAYEKGYRLLGDYYNGINWAYLLNVRATQPGTPPEEAIADAVLARRARRDVARLCAERLAALEAKAGTEEERYWVLATQAEAALGQGDEAGCAALMARATPLAAGKAWMTDTTQDQLGKLRALLAQVPLQPLPA